MKFSVKKKILEILKNIQTYKSYAGWSKINKNKVNIGGSLKQMITYIGEE